MEIMCTGIDGDYETGIRRKICHSIYQYIKANNKYMKDNDKI